MAREETPQYRTYDSYLADESGTPANAPVTNALDGFLARLGIKNHNLSDQITAAVHSALEAVHISAEVVRLRHSELVLAATPQQATLLRYQVDQLMQLLAEQFPGEVTSIKVRSKR